MKKYIKEVEVMNIQHYSMLKFSNMNISKFTQKKINSSNKFKIILLIPND